MKELIFFAAFALCVPMGTLLAVASRKIHGLVFVLLVFGTSNTAAFLGLMAMDINFVSREWYRGTSRGIEVTYVDLLMCILLASTLIIRAQEGRKIFFVPKSSGWMVALFLYGCLHTLVLADPKLFALFELSKTLRGILIFVTVALYVRSQRELELLFWAMCAAVGYEAFKCLELRYIHGVHRVSGTLGHPNILSHYMLVFVPFMIAGALSHVRTPLRVVCFLGFLAAAGCVLLSISRTGFAALVLITAGCGAVCMGLKLSPRNIAIVVLASLAFLGVLARSWDTIQDRLFARSFQDEFSEDTLTGRGVYLRYLFLILEEEPLGVGFNNWSYAVTNDYASKLGVIYNPYTGTDVAPSQSRESVEDTMGGAQTAPAHNIFILTMGELGWPGIFLFCGMIGTWLFMSGIFMIKRSDTLVSRFGVAAFFAISGIILQGLTECDFRATPVFFQVHIVAGALAAVYRHRDNA